jgi:hypothetical protein
MTATSDRTLTSEQSIIDLTAGSVVVLHTLRRGFLKSDVYKTYYGDDWIEMDPGDMSDGSTAYPKDALWVIATVRDKMTPALAWTAGDVVVPVASADELAALPNQSVVVLVSGGPDDQVADIFQKSHGSWMEMNPWDRDDGEYSLSHVQLFASASPDNVLHVAWTAPERE